MVSNLIVEFKLLHPDAKRPEYKTDGASGMDLCAVDCAEFTGGQRETDHHRAVKASDTDADAYAPWLGNNLWEFTKLLQGCVAKVDTGIVVSIPQGWEAQIRPRSSLSAKGILCQLGTIDSDYRGELKVVLVNLSGEPFEVKRGDRIAQLVFAPVGRAALQEVKEFSTQTVRGEGGFGSTDDDKHECATCSAKSGSPLLCARCLRARELAGTAWRGSRRAKYNDGDFSSTSAYDECLRGGSTCAKRLGKACDCKA